MSRASGERLADIRDSAARALRAVDVLQRAAAAGDDDQQQMAFDAVLYRLLVIGEAVKALPTDLLDQEPNVPWSEVARLRDLLAHHYYRIDAQIIRRTVDAPLRDLQAAAGRLMASSADEAGASGGEPPRGDGR